MHQRAGGPDRPQIEAFGYAFFPDAPPGSNVNVRAFNPSHPGPPVIVKSARVGSGRVLETVFQTAILAWCRGLYVSMPLATFSDPWHAREADVVAALGLVVNIIGRHDLTAKIALLSARYGKPSFVTYPPTGNVQLSWKLPVPATTSEQLAALKQTRREAAALVGGDWSGSSLVFQTAIPGSWSEGGR